MPIIIPVQSMKSQIDHMRHPIRNHITGTMKSLIGIAINGHKSTKFQ